METEHMNTILNWIEKRFNKTIQPTDFDTYKKRIKHSIILLQEYFIRKIPPNENNIEVNGILDNATYKAIYKYAYIYMDKTKEADRELIRILRLVLNIHGYNIGLHGDWDIDIKKSLSDFKHKCKFHSLYKSNPFAINDRVWKLLLTWDEEDNNNQKKEDDI